MRRIFLCLVTAVALVAASLGTPAFALGTVHEYFWNTSGIVHEAGNAAIYTFSFNGVAYNDRTVWEEGTGWDPSDYMWSGPKVDISGSSDYQECWYYIAPAGWPATVVFDIAYDANPTIVQYSVTKTIPAVAPTDIWQLQRFCHDLTLTTGAIYPKFQMRARVTSVGAGESNTFKLYKTTFQSHV